MKLICIEGNIGAGKSTLTAQLAIHLGAHPMFEPVSGNPYLERFYKDHKRYALEMQFWLMSKRFEMHQEAVRRIWTTGETVIMDRSIYGDWVFAKKNWIDGNIDDLGFETYGHHREVMSRFLLVPHKVLFLRVSPEICQERIRERGRGCESSIPTSYLWGLHDLHCELMGEMRNLGAQVIEVNWDKYGAAAEVAKLISAGAK